MSNDDLILRAKIEASRLIFKVLTNQIVVREAILNFPEHLDNKTLKVVYHALVHFEADEDLRRRDFLYRDVQDEYLEFLGNTLAKGEDLPQNIIESYAPYYSETNLSQPTKFKGFLKGLSKFLNV
jgi:hypothetical protein